MSTGMVLFISCAIKAVILAAWAEYKEHKEKKGL